MKTIEEFYEQLKTDPELQKKLTAAETGITGDDPKAAFEKIAPVIREAGYDFTVDELGVFASKHRPGSNNGDGEMSLEELDSVAGGAGGCILLGVGGSSEAICFCIFGGISSEDDRDVMTCYGLGW